MRWIRRLLAARERAIRADERKACQNAIRKWITTGHVEGTGLDKQAQRNGMILALNAITDRGREGAS